MTEQEQNSRELDMIKHVFIGMMVCMAMIFGAAQTFAANLGPGRWWQQPDMSSELKLTDKEKAALDDLFNKNRNKLIDLKGSMEKERLKLEDILGKAQLDEAAVRDQYKRMENIRSRSSAERFEFILGIRKILGAERFRTLTSKFEQMRRKKFGDHGRAPWEPTER
jgi:Spy/CpxP family protein refolding chaperone